MSLQTPSCDEHYARFPRLDRNEVLKLMEWHENQPHLPNCTGEYRIFKYTCNVKLKNCFVKGEIHSQFSSIVINLTAKKRRSYLCAQDK